MAIIDNKQAHLARYAQFATRGDERTAAFNMVGGGDLELVGLIEQLLTYKYLDVKGGKALLDIGCGPGRLARYLAHDPSLRYLGTDVVPQLLSVARQECRRDDWRFVEVEGFDIPAEDAKFDAIAIFSVMTNIYPEHSYLLVQESARTLKPGGKILITYMDIVHARHQKTFVDLTKSYMRRSDPLVFLDETFLRFFAADAGLNILEFISPDTEQCHAAPGTQLLDGRPIEGPKTLGQTLCIMEKPLS